MKWNYLIALVVILLVLLGCTPKPSTPPSPAPIAPAPAPTTAPATTPTPAPEPEPVPKTAPAEFKVDSLSVTPIVAEPGRPVTVEVKVTNVGGTQGSHRLALTINGTEEEVKDVIVAPGATKTVTFTLAKDASGMYEIKVAGLTETLRVKQAGAYPRLGNNYVNFTFF